MAEQSVDAVVVGAGAAGLYQLYRLREMGLSVRVVEAGDGVGGTWYWNRYPGARCDLQSMSYSYSFSPELEQEWTWSERYATQPEILRYLEHVADRFDLRRDITFGARVTVATYDESRGRWTVRTDRDHQLDCQYLIMASGCLSAVKEPDIPGTETFTGPVYVTGRWPHDGVDFTGLRVGVIGTGSSGVQSIPLIAEQAAELTVFQRTPPYSLPAGNRPLTPDEVAERKADYPRYRAEQRDSFFGEPIPLPTRSAFDETDEQRAATYQWQWDEGHLLKLLSVYTDVLMDVDANRTAVEFIHGKIRDTVRDPVVADALCPTTYPFGTKRPCLDTNFYQTFNADHVRLVDLRRTPIQEITERGVRTTAEEVELDALVLATGFDAMTGALTRIDIRGVGGVSLKETWAPGARSYLGIAVAGFPNLFTITGPTSPAVAANMIMAIEHHVDWIADLITHMRERGLDTAEASVEAQDEWVAHANAVGDATLLPQADSWYMGANVPGKPRTILMYFGGFGPYRRMCAQAAVNYDGFRFRRATQLASTPPTAASIS